MPIPCQSIANPIRCQSSADLSPSSENPVSIRFTSIPSSWKATPTRHSQSADIQCQSSSIQSQSDANAVSNRCQFKVEQAKICCWSSANPTRIQGRSIVNKVTIWCQSCANRRQSSTNRCQSNPNLSQSSANPGQSSASPALIQCQSCANRCQSSPNLSQFGANPAPIQGQSIVN